jgi:hypothetical protein
LLPTREKIENGPSERVWGSLRHSVDDDVMPAGRVLAVPLKRETELEAESWRLEAGSWKLKAES